MDEYAIPDATNVVKSLFLKEVKKFDQAGSLKLPAADRDLLADLLSALPAMFQETITQQSVSEGFVAGGVLNRDTGRPDLIAMMSDGVSVMTAAQLAFYERVMPRLIEEMEQHGEIRESLFDELAVDVDRKPDGSEALMVANAGTNLGSCRGVIINSEGIRKQRAEVQEKKSEKRNEEHRKHLHRHELQLENVAQLQTKFGKFSPPTSLSLASLEQFSKASAAQLNAFISTRLHKDANEYKKPFKKGKFVDADRGESNAISEAWQLRGKPDISLAPAEPTTTIGSKRNVAPQVVTVIATTSRETLVFPAASKVLAENTEFIATARSVLMGSKCHFQSSNTDQADQLQTHLLARVRKHFKIRVPGSTKQDRVEWTQMFVEKNLGRIALIVQAAGHCISNLELVQAHQQLLSPDPTQYMLVSEIPDAAADRQPTEGAYLHTLVSSFGGCKGVRAGMVSGRNIKLRSAEHRKSADSGADSFFYQSFPTLAAATANVHRTAPHPRRGYYDDLVVNLAIGYSASDASEVLSLFQFTTQDEAFLSKLLMTRGELLSIIAKKLRCVAYLLELAYELMLAPDDDVSTNPGFESVLGVYSMP